MSSITNTLNQITQIYDTAFKPLIQSPKPGNTLCGSTLFSLFPDKPKITQRLTFISAKIKELGNKDSLFQAKFEKLWFDFSNLKARIETSNEESLVDDELIDLVKSIQKASHALQEGIIAF